MSGSNTILTNNIRSMSIALTDRITGKKVNHLHGFVEHLLFLITCGRVDARAQRAEIYDRMLLNATDITKNSDDSITITFHEPNNNTAEFDVNISLLNGGSLCRVTCDAASFDDSGFLKENISYRDIKNRFIREHMKLCREKGHPVNIKDLNGVDLSGINLSGLDLTGVKLTNVNLTNANLTNANLSGLDLTTVNLTNANLTNANLANTRLMGKNLSGLNLSGTNLSGAHLEVADLKRVNFTRANLSGASLIVADLTDANLTDANLSDANLTNANLTNANLTNANLTNANLTNANLKGAKLKGGRADNGQRSDYAGTEQIKYSRVLDLTLPGRNATEEEYIHFNKQLSQRFKTLALLTHPDKIHQNDETTFKEQNDKFKIILEAKLGLSEYIKKHITFQLNDINTDPSDGSTKETSDNNTSSFDDVD